MRAILPTLLFVALAAGQAAAPKDPDEFFTLAIDGREHELVGGRAQEIEVGGRKVSVQITPRPYRLLETKWFSFRFPRRQLFGYEDDEGVQSWTVDGAESFIGITRTEGDDVDAELRTWAEELRAENAPVPATIQLGRLQLKGLRIDSKAESDVATRSLLFGLKIAGRVFVIQVFDLPKEDGTMSDEMRGAYDLFRKTFELR